MPRTTEATDATVYATNDKGSVCQRCIRCKTWAPIWNPFGGTTIRVGELIRMRNPRLGERMANGMRDERGLLVFPKITKGHGCPTCVKELTGLQVRRSDAFLPPLK